jgi:aminoglycoside phosphotransferase (APT) family kinase protein
MCPFFRAPRLLFQSAGAAIEVRSQVDGLVDPQGIFRRALADSDLSLRIGHSVGEILAEFHSALPRDQVRALLPERAPWPPSSDWIRENLPRGLDDRALIDEIYALLTKYDSLHIADVDRVAVHGEIGFHNLVFQPDTLEVVGIFDFDGAAFTDRHFDLRCLELHPEQPALLEAAIAAYQARTGQALFRQRILLYNAASTFGFLAFRSGHAPEERWCGRTLDEDLGWCRQAISKLQAPGF